MLEWLDLLLHWGSNPLLQAAIWVALGMGLRGWAVRELIRERQSLIDQLTAELELRERLSGRAERNGEDRHA